MLRSVPINAERALHLGLIDAIAPSDELLSSAAELVRQASEIPRTSRRVEKIADAAANRAAIAEAQERAAAAPAEIIAPRKIVEAVRVGLEQSFTAGLLAEQEAFRQCMDTRAAQNKIYIFCASRQTGKIAGVADTPPARITTAGVVGMGTMGTGIAQALLQAGLSVVACDENETALAAADKRLKRRSKSALPKEDSPQAMPSERRPC